MGSRYRRAAYMCRRSSGCRLLTPLARVPSPATLAVDRQGSPVASASRWNYS